MQPQRATASGAPRIVVIGAGPGGVACAALLAHRGFRVTLLEREGRIGGRTGCLEVNGFKFDIGPTFLMMKFILDAIFEETGKRSQDYLQFTRLDPMYELRFGDRVLAPRSDHRETKRQIDQLFPGLSGGFDRFIATEAKRFERMIPCLQRDYSSPRRLVGWPLLRALPHLSLTQSVFDVLKGYFPNDELALLFSFQSKYLGMSAWRCPGAFAMLSYIEHAYGIYHTQGGLSAIPEALAKLAGEKGAEVRLRSPVRQLRLQGRTVTGVELVSGEAIEADAVVLGADFGHAMTRLVPPGVLRKYTTDGLSRLQLSCSTFMMHLGLDRVYDLPHHTIVFAREYRRNVEEIFERGVPSSDLSFYVRNASVTDPTLAPPGKSSVYVLVPVPNLRSGIDWSEYRPKYRQLTLAALADRLGLKDLERHIEVERIFTPKSWADDLSVYEGATFNLAHNLRQMAYWRPRNRFEELDRCYLVGGGTHPGSGLPTIFESARITANLISDQHGVAYPSQALRLDALTSA